MPGNKTSLGIRLRVLALSALLLSVVCGYNACGPAFRMSPEAMRSLSSAGAPNGGLTPPNKLNGEALYSSKCAGCHQDLSVSTKKNRTPQQIASALQTIPQMKPFAELVSEDEIAIISWVLAGRSSVQPAELERFICKDPSAIGASKLRRLTKYELGNTLRDLLGPDVVTALADPLGAVPADPVVAGYDNTEPAVSSEHILAYLGLAAAASDLVVSNSTYLQRVAGGCAAQRPLNPTCLSNFIKNFGLRAFRRPLTASEETEFKDLYAGRASVSEDSAIGLILMSMLQSPYFTYRVENGETPHSQANTYALSPYELASRMSYLAWGTMPDTALLTAAGNGLLATEAGYKAQVDRLLADARAKANFKHFYRQWLKLGAIPQLSHSTTFLGDLNQDGLRDAMITETEDFIDHTVWEQKGSYRDLMTSNRVFPRTESMASIYGTSIWEPGKAPLALAQGERDGLLTRAAMLAAATGTDANHPILRGAFIRRQILCGALPSPVAGDLPADALTPPKSTGSQSTRELYAQKTAPDTCMRCHSQINPLGFALSDFDSIGRKQTTEKIYDSTGKLLGSPSVDTKVDLKIEEPLSVSVQASSELGSRIADSGVGAACLVSQWHRFAMARREASADGCALQDMQKTLAGGGSIQTMIRKTFDSPSFKYRRAE